MTKKANCPECGAPLLADAPDGLCASCLLREALPAREGSASFSSTSSAGAGKLPLSRVGDYELVREIARGGMGVVYLARQLSLNRLVALKMISAGRLATEAEVQRFHTEAEAAARLDHPNIVPIYEVGEKDGCHFFTMKFVEGGSLSEQISKAGFSYAPQDAAALVAQIARAVHYAHQRGILHRDLKPTNILLDARGEPLLTDFGLAKLLESEAALTQSISVMGTANYMSPEQASGRAREVTTAADVYSLGAILFELLTGRPPFQAENVVATLRKVIDEEPPRLTSIKPGISRDLETICLKCLNKSPQQRYSSAQALAEDLDRSCRHEPILARPTGTWERFAKTARRRPAVTALSGAMALALLLGAAGILSQWRRAEQNAAQSRSRLVHSYVANGVKRMDDGDLFGSLPWLLEASRIEQNDPRATEMHRLRLDSILRQCPKLVHIWFHEAPVNDAQLSPDGRLAATGTSAGTVRIWNVHSGEMVGAPMMAGKQIHNVQFSPDSRLLLTITGDPAIGGWEYGFAELWDTATSKSLGRIGQEGRSVDAAAFSPDSAKIAIASWVPQTSPDGSAVIWDLQSRQTVSSLMHHRYRISSLQFSADGSRLLSGSFDGTAQVWNARTGMPEGAPLRHKSGLLQASFNPDGTRVVTAGQNGVAQAWEIPAGEPVGPPMAQSRIIYGAAFSPDNQTVLTMGYDATARIWNPDTGVQICPPLKHDILVFKACFSPDAAHVATASFDNTARVWNSATGEPATPPLNHGGFLQAASFSKDGYLLLTGSRDSTARLWAWDRKNGDTLTLLPGGAVSQGEFSPDGTRVLTACDGGTADLWDANTGAHQLAFRHKRKVNSASFSPDGKWIITGSSDATARIWDAATGSAISDPLLHTNSVRSVSFSKDGSRVLTASADHTAQVWDPRTGERIGAAMQHTNALRDACFSPDGRLVATGSDDSTARVWDASTGRAITPPLLHPSDVRKVAFSPDNKRIAVCCFDRTFNALAAHVWEVGTSREVFRLQHKDGVSWAEFSPDGRRIVTAGEDQCARIWDAQTGQPLTPSLVHKHHVTTAVFSRDGKKVATASFDKSARIWSAETGEPLTPFLPHDDIVNHITFSPDSQRVLTSCSDGRARIWTLTTNSSSIPQMALLSELLSGKRVDVRGGLGEVDASSLSNAWRTLRAAAPSTFGAAPAEVAGWHWQEVFRAERAGQPFQTRFHLQQLADAGDPAARQRLEDIQGQLPASSAAAGSPK